MTTRSLLPAALTAAGFLCVAAPTQAAEVQPQIVKGGQVSTAVQQRLGLVTLSNGCSGTLLNRRWVLTADHCLGGGVTGGPDAPFANVQISSIWSSQVATPTRYVRFFKTDGVDVALIELGNGDLGPAWEQNLADGLVGNNTPVTKYGRGICQYARFDSNGVAVPAETNCGYRSARFTVSDSENTQYLTRANSLGQVGNGGDSGGPDFITVNGVASIVGVQSGCHYTKCLVDGLCKKPDGGANWKWVTEIDYCNSMSIPNIRPRLVESLYCNGAAGCAASDVANLLLLTK